MSSLFMPRLLLVWYYSGTARAAIDSAAVSANAKSQSQSFFCSACVTF